MLSMDSGFLRIESLIAMKQARTSQHLLIFIIRIKAQRHLSVRNFTENSSHNPITYSVALLGSVYGLILFVQCEPFFTSSKNAGLALINYCLKAER